VTFLGKDDVWVFPTRDGSATLFSKEFNTTYHSINGAVGESRHVFIQHGLMTQMDRRSISVLEFGFGTGLNAFLAYLLSQKFNLPVQYTGIDNTRIDPAIIDALGYPDYLAATKQAHVFKRMHDNAPWHESSFSFEKHYSITAIKDKSSFDCIFFDAFDPAIQQELWSEEVFKTLFHLTSPGGCLVTYCAQGEVRRKLERSGFLTERLPGAPGKREMIRSIRPS
jgi:tRNA U34 5-methylaminomethyl-2-thiouridine-forming methyltransferase MnmC